MKFYKYQGAGNDFVIIDDREEAFPESNNELIARLCDRHFGVGADGLMLLRNQDGYDFKMVYFNADGRPSSMCGNGGRCLVAFAHRLGLIQDRTLFTAVDGEHEAEVIAPDQIRLAMNDVNDWSAPDEEALLIDTGSPHYIIRRKHIASIDMLMEGRTIRNRSEFGRDGVNVNFVERKQDDVYIRTYERGVEDETLACGTGVTAAALAMAIWESMPSPVKLHALGGELMVEFEQTDKGFENIWKTGPATLVFEGSVDL